MRTQLTKDAQVTAKMIEWEIFKIDQEVRRRQAKLEAAVDVLKYWMSVLKTQFPTEFENMLITNSPVLPKPEEK